MAVEQNYTIILGSHRNSKLKIEKNGDEQASVSIDGTCWHLLLSRGCSRPAEHAEQLPLPFS
jgi:hypothetical protein